MNEGGNNQDQAKQADQEQAKGAGAAGTQARATSSGGRTGITATREAPPKLTVVELGPLSIQGNGKPGRRVTLTCELPEAISEMIKPGMTWDGDDLFEADGTPVELRELSTA